MNEQHKPCDTAIVPAQASSSLPAIFSGGRPETVKALRKAVAGCPKVEKRGWNDHHKYHYPKAEDVIEAGRTALLDAGILPVLLDMRVDGHDREGPDRFELVCTFGLFHESGEATPLKVTWPIVPDRGRPLDKAAAAAMTLAYSYMLKTLLMMPVVDESEEVAARQDNQAPQPQKSKPQKRPPADGAELMAFLTRYEAGMVKQNKCKTGELVAHVLKMAKLLGHPDDMTRWPAGALGLAGDWIRTFVATANSGPQQPTSSEKAKKLQKFLAEKRIPWTGALGMCKHLKVPETTMIEDLTPEQYATAWKTAEEVP